MLVETCSLKRASKDGTVPVDRASKGGRSLAVPFIRRPGPCQMAKGSVGRRQQELVSSGVYYYQSDYSRTHPYIGDMELAVSLVDVVTLRTHHYTDRWHVAKNFAAQHECKQKVQKSNEL